MSQNTLLKRLLALRSEAQEKEGIEIAKRLRPMTPEKRQEYVHNITEDFIKGIESKIKMFPFEKEYSVRVTYPSMSPSEGVYTVQDFCADLRRHLEEDKGLKVTLTFRGYDEYRPKTKPSLTVTLHLA